MNVWNLQKRLLPITVSLFCLGSSSAFGGAQSALTFQPALITTIAGTGVAGYTGDGGVATSTLVSSNIKGIVADASGDIFFVDGTYCTVRVVFEGGATAAQLITA